VARGVVVSLVVEVLAAGAYRFFQPLLRAVDIVFLIVDEPAIPVDDLFAKQVMAEIEELAVVFAHKTLVFLSGLNFSAAKVANV